MASFQCVRNAMAFVHLTEVDIKELKVVKINAEYIHYNTPHTHVVGFASEIPQIVAIENITNRDIKLTK